MPSQFPQMLSRMRSLREERGLSQKMVAERLGISQQYYSRYEKGETELPLRHFAALVDLYGVPAGYLLGREELPADRPGLSDDCTAGEAAEALLALSGPDREKAVEYIRLLAMKESLSPPPVKKEKEKPRKKKKGKAKRS